ncbi:hypothetical protein QBC35DRAFT_484886 [Podospora australis]|uniref:Uncharacterized protein n=1 Tax=Podospora australis TaxID=1536484 RepID=A0AAN7AN77_9PEZI|nr:hypothetical protein QBC35DRAFT_484886 [Podospora australis]
MILLEIVHGSIITAVLLSILLLVILLIVLPGDISVIITIILVLIIPSSIPIHLPVHKSRLPARVLIHVLHKFCLSEVILLGHTPQKSKLLRDQSLEPSLIGDSGEHTPDLAQE